MHTWAMYGMNYCLKCRCLDCGGLPGIQTHSHQSGVGLPYITCLFRHVRILHIAVLHCAPFVFLVMIDMCSSLGGVHHASTMWRG